MLLLAAFPRRAYNRAYAHAHTQQRCQPRPRENKKKRTCFRIPLNKETDQNTEDNTKQHSTRQISCQQLFHLCTSAIDYPPPTCPPDRASPSRNTLRTPLVLTPRNAGLPICV